MGQYLYNLLYRDQKPISEQFEFMNIDLVNAVREVVPERYLNKTLSRVFQAFRIKVNDELTNIYNSVIYLFVKYFFQF